MNRKRKVLLTYAILAAFACAIVLGIFTFEREIVGQGAAQTMRCLSDGFFTAAVLAIGCSLLMYIQDAGNFYGTQYLFYMLVRLFSSRQKRYEQKKDCFTYCTEKKARLEADGPSPIKKAMLLVGLVCFALALGFVLVYYRMV